MSIDFVVRKKLNELCSRIAPVHATGSLFQRPGDAFWKNVEWIISGVAGRRGAGEEEEEQEQNKQREDEEEEEGKLRGRGWKSRRRNRGRVRGNEE